MDRISARALNRATLARQMLLARATATPLDAVRALIGLQAQAPFPPYFGLWSRVADFRADDLGDLIADRSVVRIPAMRSTVHLMATDDAREIRPLVQPVLERALRSSMFGRALREVDPVALASRARALLDEAPRTGAALAAALASAYPDVDPTALSNAARTHLPLVQIPPRGLWGRSGQPVLATLESWSGAPCATQPSPEAAVLRYLAAFGPATVADVQAWSGLTRLAEVVDRIKDRLVMLAGPGGATLYDLPDAPRPDEDVPAPVRMLAEFDNLTLSYADRGRVLSDEDRRRAYTVNGIVPGLLLVDGVVHGTWKITRSRSSATLTVVPFRPIPRRHRSNVEAEAQALLDFAATAPGFPAERSVVLTAVLV